MPLESAAQLGLCTREPGVPQVGFQVQVGFNSTPSFNPADDFWPAMGTLATPAFLTALDYVALDFFPDVFRPLPGDGSLDTLAQAVEGVLKHFRQKCLALGGIPATVPMHIGENGWPTSPTRSYVRQAEVLETILRTIYAQRAALNITHYVHFGLRDADSANPGIQYQFGLLRDDYTPKPAFSRYQSFIAELGSGVLRVLDV